MAWTDTAANTPGEEIPEAPTTGDDTWLIERLSLVSALQTTLDPSEQIAIFFKWMQSQIATDSVHYLHPQWGLEYLQGRSRRHRCEYQLSTAEESLGNLTFSRHRPFSELELKQIEVLLSAMHFPLRNALRYHGAVESAMTDALTGTGNRNAMDTTLQREGQLAERYQQPLSLVLLDVDHFKSVNDTLGHSMGDLILQQLAESIQLEARETDLLFRYGGEEFVLVLSNTDLTGAKILAERLREGVATSTFGKKELPVNLTVSVGISSWQSQDHPKQLFDRADQALYQSKLSGRNRVSVHAAATRQASTT